MEEWERELEACSDADEMPDTEQVLKMYLDSLMARVELCRALGQETTMRALLKVVEDLSRIAGLI